MAVRTGGHYFRSNVTLLKFVNIVFCQWFFIRLAKTQNVKTGETIGWGVMFPIVPLTGWFSDYVPRRYNVWTFVGKTESGACKYPRSNSGRYKSNARNSP